MQSRTDQVHSYQFFLHRVISGLVARESDPAELPFRRLGWSAFGSIMVMVLVAAGFGVYGLYVGGGATSWQDGRSVIVEKESRAPYIYRESRLYPMVNMVSAQLALGGNARVVQVTARSLEGVPRGPTLGIPGAPEDLPDNRGLLVGDWTMCSQQQDDGRGGEETLSVLGVGRQPGGGRPADQQAVLVRDADADGYHLIWHGHRFDLAEVEPQTLRALGLVPERALPVAPAWLDTLPVGDPLAPPDVPDRGEPVDWLDEELDARTGQVILANRTFYLVQSGSLDQITELQAELVLADPATVAAYPNGGPRPREDIPSGALTGVTVRVLPEPGVTSPPQVPPEVVSLAGQDAQEAAICVVFPPGRFVPEVWAGARLPWEREGNPTTQRTDEGAMLADYVVVTGGKAALVQALASPEAPGGTWHLVNDQGVQFGLTSPEVAGMLGYDLRKRMPVATTLVDRLPAGPLLNPAAALLPADTVRPPDEP